MSSTLKVDNIEPATGTTVSITGYTPTIAANLAMNSFKLTGLAAGTTSGDSIRYEQVVGVYVPLTGGTLTGDLLFTDATYDIGKTGATRPRDVFASRNVTVGGTLSVTGHPTLEGVTATGATGTGKLVFDTSPTLVTASLGSSTATTQAANDNSTKVATTAYVDSKTYLTQGTPTATTSGTSVDYTSLPSTLKRITIMFKGVSTNGTSNLLIQIGDASGGLKTSGYSSNCYAGGVGTLTSTAGFLVTENGAAANTMHGAIVLTRESSSAFSWTSTGNLFCAGANTCDSSAGSVSLTAALDRVRITTVNGTDAFDAGEVNIMYE